MDFFFITFLLIQKCSEEKIHLFSGTIKVEILSAIPTDHEVGGPGDFFNLIFLYPC